MSSTPLAFVPGAQVTRARRAEGALSGLTFAAKDVFALRGHASTAGHPDWARTHAAADHDAPVISKLLEAGADLVGVTILDELAYSLSGQNQFYGTPSNPRAPGRLCGGSSCGSAAAVASCLCDFALGTDTGGSIRVPASFCGLFGLRPTHGRIDSRGVVPLAPSFDTVGFLARDARTFEAVASVLLASDADLAGAAADEPALERVLIADDALALCDAGVAELLEHLLAQVLGKLQVPSERVKLATMGFESLRVAFQRTQGRDAFATHGAWLDAEHPQFSPAITQRFERARALSRSQEGRDEDEATMNSISERLEALLSPGTLLFMPATPGIAPRIADSDSALEAFRARTLELTCAASLTGVPQLVVPAVELQGAPIGLSFIGPWGSDRSLCALASLLERALR
ncbi:MAG: amidase [Myxococcales bacterium]